VLELEIKLVSEEETDELEETEALELEDSDETEVVLKAVAEANDKVSLNKLELVELLVLLELDELASALDDALSELAEETL
jgi:hypothetical protein